jgi:beta-phosphoglucomutase
MNQKMQYRGVIFDMDGVIVDNQDYHHEAWMKFCMKYGVTVEGDVSRYFGMTNTDILTNIFPDKLSDTQLYEYSGEKEKLYRGLYQGNIEMAEGLERVLKSLLDKDMKLGIATSAPSANVDFVLGNTNLHIYFDVVVDSSMVSKGKPDPEIYLMAAEQMGLLPEQCIVVEDSIAGVKAGKAAGMKVIAITTTSAREKLGDADKIIDHFNEFEL